MVAFFFRFGGGFASSRSKKDWMPIVHNGSYTNRGACSAFWPPKKHHGSAYVRFRTLKKNIPEDEWNIQATKSELRRRASVIILTTPTTMQSGGAPASSLQSSLQSSYFDISLDTCLFFYPIVFFFFKFVI